MRIPAPPYIVLSAAILVGAAVLGGTEWLVIATVTLWVLNYLDWWCFDKAARLMDMAIDAEDRRMRRENDDEPNPAMVELLARMRKELSRPNEFGSGFIALWIVSQGVEPWKPTDADS